VGAAVEETVLGLIDQRTFRKADFAETLTVEVRVRPPLSHELVIIVGPLLRDRLGPAAERMAQMIARAADGKVEVPTPLTSARIGKVTRTRKSRFAGGLPGMRSVPARPPGAPLLVRRLPPRGAHRAEPGAGRYGAQAASP
jgi:hypothetical protein